LQTCGKTALGARIVGEQPGFTLMAIIHIGTGHWGQYGDLSVVNACCYVPCLPQPERLVFLYDSITGFWHGQGWLMKPSICVCAIRRQALEQVALYTSTTLTLTGAAETERIYAGLLPAICLPRYGMPLALGRTFKLEEEPRGASNVVISVTAFWQRKVCRNALMPSGNHSRSMGAITRSLAYCRRASNPRSN